MKKSGNDTFLVNMLGVSIASLLLSANFNIANADDDGVMFMDIVSKEDSGLVYRRTESPRDAIFDVLKSQDVLLFQEAPLIPMKTHGSPGVAILDYDKDGDMDVYVTNGPGSANSLFENQLVEEGEMEFVDVASNAGVSATDMDSAGVCYGDIDNDGDHDLYVLGTGEPNRLYENTGDGKFYEITETSGVGAGNSNPSGCSMGDINGDGLLDIVVANTWSDWDNRIAIFEAFADIEHNQLFVNKGDNSFEDVSAESGIQELSGFAGDLQGSPGITWAIAMVDYDQDGDIDILMVDDQGEVLDPANGGFDRGLIHLMNNDGSGKFTDVNVETGLNRVGAWMSLSFGDLNSDGIMDMFVSNLGDFMFTVIPRPAPYQVGEFASRWFLGQEDGSFSDQGVGDLIATPFGWGSVMADYDNDGDTDILYQGGLDVGPLVELSNPGVVLQNDGNANFTYDLNALKNSTNHTLRNVQGYAAGDLNNDGFVDLVSVSSFDIPESFPLVPFNAGWGSGVDDVAAFFPSFTPIAPGEFVYNNLEPVDGSLSVEINSADNDNNWVNVELMGMAGVTSEGRVNRDAIGAVIKFTPEDGKTVMKPVLGGASYASQDSLKAGFGLGEGEKGMLEVLWPGGVKNRYYGVRASESVMLPEIPCSFDAEWESKSDYRHCLKDALKDLKKKGVINNKQKKRLMVSAMYAYMQENKNK